MKIILPKTLVDPKGLPRPIFFLAGPVKGGGDWQKECCSILQDFFNDFTAILPNRYPEDHPLRRYAIEGRDFGGRQTRWERACLALAAEMGCIIFWLPTESVTAPRDGGDYARETRGEIGEWRGRMMADRRLRKVAVGGEKGFPGISQIKENFDAALGRDFSIQPTLRATVEAAASLARR